ncbi:ABC transporter substrate-binding protein [Kineococcus sp. SYSU DK002]|uniref:ABC transporter substrate-binding protein n=1 Tax=Kineococcus sp. SYSU DK002 TaxID=3383123 RepID=UPI003D7C6DD5
MSTPSAKSTPLSRRAFTTAALGTTAAAGLTACGGSSSSSSGPVTLRMSWWGGDTRHQYTQQLIEKFNSTHSDIQIKGEFGEWSGYWDKLATTVAANDAPDIFQMDEKYLRSYGDRGALMDLSELEGLDTSGIDASSLETGRTPDGLLGLVIAIHPLGMVTNPTVLEAAGVAVPDDTTWTWEDYHRIGAQVTAASPAGTYGIANSGLEENQLQLWVKQNGASFYDEDGKVVLPEEHLVSWWEYGLGILPDNAAGPVSLAIESASASLEQTPLATNRVGFQTYWAGQVVAFTKASGAPLKLLRPPRQTTSGEWGLYYKPSMFWSASSRTENPEAVATVLDWFTNAEEVQDAMLVERGIPANPAVRERIAPLLDPAGQVAIGYTDAVADVIAATPPSAPAGASDIEAIVRRYGSDVLFGKQTPQAAARGLVDELTNSVESA